MVNSKGRAYTQRVEPKLALVEVALPTEAFSEGWEPNNDSYLGSVMVFSHLVQDRLKFTYMFYYCII